MEPSSFHVSEFGIKLSSQIIILDQAFNNIYWLFSDWRIMDSVERTMQYVLGSCWACVIISPSLWVCHMIFLVWGCHICFSLVLTLLIVLAFIKGYNLIGERCKLIREMVTFANFCFFPTHRKCLLSFYILPTCIWIVSLTPKIRGGQ